MIIGQPGAGKSTLAREMGRILDLPVFHIDHIHWMPGWRERPREDKTRLCREVHALDRWIFEGGHSVTWPERLARADMLVWIDLPISLRLWRVTRRGLRKEHRPDLPADCPERLDPEFLRWIWATRHSARINCARLFQGAGDDKRRFHLRNPRAVRGFSVALAYARRKGTLG
ncbi:topology modulation protein [Jannaschia aquimarina]|uniref:Topology modulation protein n=2 Tax=Jannaschia aquimarina TaxID=935700 RepID=A0A0D1CIE3_9RHOB|nr:topology modulation protein [Jannaschia aquimarina]SNT28827.1 hypothetical protein SAMN05421775_11032 [Jannaschia aquimarina]